MKKIILFSLILFFSTSIDAQINNYKSTYQRLDSTIYTGRRKEVFLYDSLMRNTEWLVGSVHPINHTWMKGGRTTYEYNDDDQLILETEYTGSDPFTSWEKNHKHEYFYDGNGIDSVKISYFWSSYNIWQEQYKEKYCYSNTGILDSISVYSWNSNQNNWKYSGHIIRNYNSNNGLVLLLNEYIDQSSNTWAGNDKSIYTRDSKNRIFSETYQIWDYMGTGNWENVVRLYSFYDVAGDLLNCEMYDYDYSYYYWKLQYKYTTSFDTSIMAQNIVLPLYYDIHGIGRKHSDFLVHKPLYTVNYIRTNQNSWALTGDSTLFFYSDIYTSIEKPEEHIAFTISPNPASSFLNIKGLDLTKKYNAQVYDVNGRLIIDQILTDSKLKLSQLTSGIYILRLRSDGNIIGNTKFIKR